MATVEEKYAGRHAREAGETTERLLATELTYQVRYAADEAAAVTAVRAEAPATWNGLERGAVTVTEGDGGIWEARVQYDPPADTGTDTYSFETGGGSQHITQSKETVGSYVASGTAPDFKGAIGVTKDAVAGCDIVVPVYRFSETHEFDSADVTAEYIGALYRLTGKTNELDFRGLEPGECLFLGAAGSKKPDSGKWEIQFDFAGSPNETDLAVGDITDIAKGGWHYLWVLYEDTVDDTAKALVKTPKAVYVERVYDVGDFDELNIG